MMTEHVIMALAAINAAAFAAYGIDKLKARSGKWRISEVALLLIALLGGSMGAWLGIKVWHHKTQHWKFKYGIPLILIAQATACIALFGNHIHEMLGV